MKLILALMIVISVATLLWYASPSYDQAFTGTGYGYSIEK